MIMIVKVLVIRHASFKTIGVESHGDHLHIMKGDPYVLINSIAHGYSKF